VNWFLLVGILLTDQSGTLSVPARSPAQTENR